MKCLFMPTGIFFNKILTSRNVISQYKEFYNLINENQMNNEVIEIDMREYQIEDEVLFKIIEFLYSCTLLLDETFYNDKFLEKLYYYSKKFKILLLSQFLENDLLYDTIKNCLFFFNSKSPCQNYFKIFFNNLFLQSKIMMILKMNLPQKVLFFIMVRDGEYCC
jgi:hypothetical protein